MAAETPADPPDNIDATLTIHARLEGAGLFISLKSEGDYSGETIDRRFYSIDELPPAGLPPYLFWGTLIRNVGGLLAASDEILVPGAAELEQRAAQPGELER